MVHLIEQKYVTDDIRALVLMQERTMDDEFALSLKFDQLMPDEHKFLDTYGPDCILAQVGLSWWRDVVPNLNEQFVLEPEQCIELAALIMNSMPPEPIKVIQALSEGTELSHCVHTYPEANVVRSPEIPYTSEEVSRLYFKLGQLCGILSNGAQRDGILVSP